MKLGLLLQAVDHPREFPGLVREVEAMGFDHVLVADSSLHARDAYPYLTLALAGSERLLVGSGVTHPFSRHPGVTANAMSTLAQLSGGRAVLGIGVGDRPLHELGLRSAKRATLREAVNACRGLTAGESVTCENGGFTLRDAHLRFPPEAPVPVWIAASGPLTLSLAGEVADGVLAQIGLTPAHVEFSLGRVREGAAAADRQPPEFGVVMYGAIGEDRARARSESRHIAAWFAQTAPVHCELAGVDPELVARIREAYSGGELHEADDAAALVTEEMVDRLTIAGTPAEVRGRLEELEAAGVQRFTYMPMGADRWAGVRSLANAMA